MKALIQIQAEGEDVTHNVRPYLVGLDLNDEAGYDADRMSMTLDDREGQLIVPRHGSKVSLALGLESGLESVPLTPMGEWVVDETELSGMPRQLRITATACDMSGDIKKPRTRPWEGVTVFDIVSKMAQEASLTPVVDEDLANVKIAYSAQSAESNLHFLTRLSRSIGAIAKPVAGRLVMARRGSPRSADGAPLPNLDVFPGDTNSWSWRASERDQYASAEAQWADIDNGQTNKVVVGEGDPRRVLRHIFNTEEEAQRNARSAIERSRRGAQTLNLDMASFHPEAFAGRPLQFFDRRPEVQGRWLITTVTHRLSGSLLTTITAERDPKEPEDPDDSD